MAKLNYYWEAHGIDGWVGDTTDPVDGVEVFATFSEARRALGDWFDHVAKEFDARRYWARKMLKADLEPDFAGFRRATVDSVARRHSPQKGQEAPDDDDDPAARRRPQGSS